MYNKAVAIHAASASFRQLWTWSQIKVPAKLGRSSSSLWATCQPVGRVKKTKQVTIRSATLRNIPTAISLYYLWFSSASFFHLANHNGMCIIHMKNSTRYCLGNMYSADVWVNKFTFSTVGPLVDEGGHIQLIALWMSMLCDYRSTKVLHNWTSCTDRRNLPSQPLGFCRIPSIIVRASFEWRW